MADIKPNPKALSEALQLSEDILRNIELSEIPLSQIALKVTRLARLLNDFDHQKIFAFDSGGVPTESGHLNQENWRLAVLGKRIYQEFNKEKKEHLNYAFTESIGQLESEEEAAKIGIEAAKDADVSVSSANPNQYVHAPIGNFMERNKHHSRLTVVTNRISSRRTFIYDYALRKNHELKFSGIASDVFSRIRESADKLIGDYLSDSVNKFQSVYDNLSSENPEDWANAVHSCRRILQDTADIIFPATEIEREAVANGKKTKVKLGKDNYVNRIVAFVSDNSSSRRFQDIVGSNLEYLGNRLDSIFQAAQKGSHSNIIDRTEADRYVVYTYMLVGDVLKLYGDVVTTKALVVAPGLASLN